MTDFDFAVSIVQNENKKIKNRYVKLDATTEMVRAAGVVMGVFTAHNDMQRKALHDLGKAIKEMQ